MPPKRSSSRLVGTTVRAPRTSSSNPVAQSDENPPVLGDIKNVLGSAPSRSRRKPLTPRNAVPQSTRPQPAAMATRRTRRVVDSASKALMSQYTPVEQPARQGGTTAPLTRPRVADSDEPEYVDLPMTQSRTRPQRAVSVQKRAPAPPMSPSVSSHGSSDKENVPPRTQFHTAPRPIASTPRVRDVLQEVQHMPSLDEMLSISSRGSDESFGSPGVGRRMPSVDAKMQAYQDLGVSKVRAWKAAKHDQAPVAAPEPSDSISLAYTGETGLPPDDDEFGFMDAERRIKLRNTKMAENEDSIEDFDDSVPPSSVPGLPSEDAILAANAFNMSSSPVEPLTATPMQTRVTRSSRAKQSSSSSIAQTFSQSLSDAETKAQPARRTPRAKGKQRAVSPSSRSSSPNTTMTQPKKLRMDDVLSLLPRRKPPAAAAVPKRAARNPRAKAAAKPTSAKGKKRAPPSSTPPKLVSSTPASSDSDRTRRIRQYKTAEKYTLETEFVL